jgi:cytochrome c5
MKNFMTILVLCAGAALLVLSGCGSAPDDATAAATVGTAAKEPAAAPALQLSLHGSALYATNCARCHGPLATSTKKISTARLIQSAITGNFGGMGYIVLTVPEIQAIAASLAGQVSSTPGTLPGKVIYDSTCSECHRLGSYDSAGMAANLAGKTGMIPVKINSGHKGINLNPRQLTDLVDFMGGY